MSQKTVYVCDDCGKAAVESVQVSTSRGKVELDVCSTHLAGILSRGRAVRRGRKPNGALPRTKATAARKSTRTPKPKKPAAP